MELLTSFNLSSTTVLFRNFSFFTQLLFFKQQFSSATYISFSGMKICFILIKCNFLIAFSLKLPFCHLKSNEAPSTYLFTTPSLPSYILRREDNHIHKTIRAPYFRISPSFLFFLSFRSLLKKINDQLHISSSPSLIPTKILVHTNN